MNQRTRCGPLVPQQNWCSRQDSAIETTSFESKTDQNALWYSILKLVVQVQNIKPTEETKVSESQEETDWQSHYGECRVTKSPFGWQYEVSAVLYSKF